MRRVKLGFDDIASPKVDKEQLHDHIYQNSKKLPAICPERTIRRYLDFGYLSTTLFN